MWKAKHKNRRAGVTRFGERVWVARDEELHFFSLSELESLTLLRRGLAGKSPADWALVAGTTPAAEAEKELTVKEVPVASYQDGRDILQSIEFDLKRESGGDQRDVFPVLGIIAVLSLVVAISLGAWIVAGTLAKKAPAAPVATVQSPLPTEYLQPRPNNQPTLDIGQTDENTLARQQEYLDKLQQQLVGQQQQPPASSRIDPTALPVSSQAWLFGNEEAEKELYLFSDPMCPYSRQFEREIQSLRADYRVYLFPSPILGSDSMAVVAQIACSANPQQAWDQWMNDQVLANVEDENAPEFEVCVTAALEASAANAALVAQDYGWGGVPVLVRGDGHVSVGSSSAAEVRSWLNSDIAGSANLLQGGSCE